MTHTAIDWPFWRWCPTCERSTRHSALTDERGTELGYFCCDCDTEHRRLQQESAAQAARIVERKTA